MAEIAVTPITEVFKCSILLLKRQIDYIVHCKRKFKQLKEKVEELERTRNDVQQRVDAAKRNLEKIHEVVEAWLVKVAKETTRNHGGDDQTNILGLIMNGEALNMISTKCWCSCGSGSRYNLGRKAEKKMFIIDALLNEGRSFGDNISSPRVIDINPMSITNQDDFEPFASREHLRDEVMEALRDEEINLIGVYGMGGVGKTTLVTQVYDQVKKEKNLFDEVVMTTISQNLDLIKIQNDIAEQLGLKQMKELESPLARANLLLMRLKQKNTLLILDDLWSDLNLFQVGIPCGGNHHKVCKVIITTRRLEVCMTLGCKININVTVLPDDDSWTLFRKNVVVGDNLAYSTGLETTAREIVKECGGLPVALVTLGRGLRFKQKHVWDDTLHKLRNSKTTCIEGMEPKVFSSIKLSYDFLDDEIYKKCFLLCCLFPDDHDIVISDLMAYVVGDDTIFEDHDEDTLKQMTDRIKTVLDKLVDSCLLLKKERRNVGVYAVSMHDVIRDVAINIASHHQEGNNWFLVRAGFGLKHWPGNSLLTSSNGTSRRLRRLSLMKNEIIVLPNDHSPNLPHLLSLSLYANKSLKEIPANFFQGMGSLTTLDLRETGISFLPCSLSSFLVNLKTLYLDECKFSQSTDISVIWMLKKLEVLSLAKCDIQGLPEEIRELTNLRWLDLSTRTYDFNFIIPKNVISSLSRLEYLNMSNRKIKWGVDDGLLAEVAYLSSLSALSLHFYWNNSEIEISFSDAADIMALNNICIANNLSSPICHPIKVLIQRVEFLKLEKCCGLKSVGQLGVGFNNLKKLDVVNCGELEYVMSLVAEEVEIPRPISSPDGCFEKLEEIQISTCSNLKYPFCTSMARNLQNLKKLTIRWCSSMVKLITSNEQLVCEDQLLLAIFPNLESLKIGFCEDLNQLWDGNNLGKDDDDANNTMTGQTSVLDFPCLKYLELFGCKKLKRIRLTHKCTEQLKRIVGKSEEWFEEVLEWENPNDKLRMRTLFFHDEWSYFEDRKKKLEITSAHYMVSVFNLNLVKRVPYVNSLFVASCDGLKDIFNLEEIGTSTTLNIEEALGDFTFSELRDMTLRNLPNLENIWKGHISSVRCFMNLETVKIGGCHKLSYLFSLSVARNLQNLKELSVDGCSGMVKLIASAEEDPLTSFKLFPNLKKLVIVSCGNLKHLWNIGKKLKKKENNDVDDDQLVMGRTTVLYLEYLEVRDCENLKRILLTHQGTRQWIEIVGDDEQWFEGLEWENSNDKSRMQHFFKEKKSLEINSAHYMVSVFNLNLVKRVPNLESLKVYKCARLKNVFSLEGTGTSTHNIDQDALSGFTFSRLAEIELRNLPILENIWKGYIPSVGCMLREP